jgi:hypothetical protein
MADKPSTIVAAVLISIVGGFPLFTLPIVGPVLQEQLGFTIQQAGQVAPIEVFGVGLASVMAMFWIRRINWRIAALIAVAAVVIGNILTIYLADPTAITVTRFFVGFVGEGTAFALGLTIISDTKETDRNFAYVIAAQVAFGVITLLTLFRLSAMFNSIGGIYIPLAAFAALSLIMLRFIPDGGAKAGRRARSGCRRTARPSPGAPASGWG